jgi:hypothetical protein
LCIAAAGCDRPTTVTVTTTRVEPPASETAGRVTAAESPLEIRMEQRTTRDVTVGGQALTLTLDDITDGQVMVTLMRPDGTPMVGPVSMRPGSRVPVSLGASNLTLELRALHDALAGTDAATFVITSAAGMSEAGKIESLLRYVQTLPGARYIRNEEAHDGETAAAHLRVKAEWKPESATTAREFIDRVATASSQTGELYKVQLSDGRVIELRALLLDELARIEAGARP